MSGKTFFDIIVGEFLQYQCMTAVICLYIV